MENRLIEELTALVLSETSVTANTVASNVIYDDHFTMKSTISIRHDGGVIVE